MLLAIYYRNGGDVEATPVELLPLGDEWQPRQTVTRNSRGQIIAWCFRDGQHHGDPVPTGSQAALDFDGISYMTLIEEADLLEGWLNFLRQRPQHPIDYDDFDDHVFPFACYNEEDDGMVEGEDCDDFDNYDE